MRVQVAHRTRAFPGEGENGDAIVVRAEEAGTLLAVIDGLGHGPKASAAAELAVRCLNSADIATPVSELVQEVHRALSGSRGAAATFLVLLGTRLQACAIGNVELRVAGGRLPFRLTAGILGKHMRRPYVVDAEVGRMRVALYSDGISSRFYLEDYGGRPLDWACEDIFSKFARSTDDASLLLADILP